MLPVFVIPIVHFRPFCVGIVRLGVDHGKAAVDVVIDWLPVDFSSLPTRNVLHKFILFVAILSNLSEIPLSQQNSNKKITNTSINDQGYHIQTCKIYIYICKFCLSSQMHDQGKG